MNSRLDVITESALEDLARKSGFRVGKLAKLCKLSPRQLNRIIHERFDEPPREWLARCRLKDASEIIESGASAKEAAAQTGYSHQTNLTRRYKQIYHLTPISLRSASQRRQMSDND